MYCKSCFCGRPGEGLPPVVLGCLFPRCHAREGRHPVLDVWIPASAGMTFVSNDVVFIQCLVSPGSLEVTRNVSEGLIPRSRCGLPVVSLPVRCCLFPRDAWIPACAEMTGNLDLSFVVHIRNTTVYRHGRRQ